MSLISKPDEIVARHSLLRHADAHTTLQLYAQSVNSSMVEAQESMLKAWPDALLASAQG